MHTGEGLVPKKRQAAMDGGLHGKGVNVKIQIKRKITSIPSYLNRHDFFLFD
ncbi:hypothetical protein [Allofranklinella schreckenbergeri]|uniref:hypothetical protein n=1 Tax=Allofranklinella schreckenbergeri TaxID=1076744 RepID=UPI001EEF452C|nr:hypothetical protein [Allofranklinella schreckenbergeri]